MEYGLDRNTKGHNIMLAGEIVGALKNRFAEGDAEPTNYAPAQAKPIDAAFRSLEALNPHLYPLWRRLFDNGTAS